MKFNLTVLRSVVPSATVEYRTGPALTVWIESVGRSCTLGNAHVVRERKKCLRIAIPGAAPHSYAE
jgi:hypothetical protein